MERLIKQSGWESRLNAYFVETSKDAFDWGTRDCCTTSLRCIEVMCVINLDRMRNDFFWYKDKSSGIDWIRKFGGFDTIIEKAMASIWLQENMNTLCTKRGDICIVKDGKQTLLGVMGLNGSVMCASKKGWSMFGINEIVRSWGIH